MLTVRIVDHSEEFLDSLYERIGIASGAACRLLADRYRESLTKTWSFQNPGGPRHSIEGEIPHKYFGHRPGGFQLHGYGEINNDGQTDFLAEYIEADERPGEPVAFVGFAPNHTEKGARGWFRGANYLITHDPLSGYGDRPWIYPVFEESRNEMAQIASQLLQ